MKNRATLGREMLRVASSTWNREIAEGKIDGLVVVVEEVELDGATVC